MIRPVRFVALYKLTLDRPPHNLQPRYNVCPTATIDVVIERDGYWGVVHIANAKFEDGVLTFDITGAIRLRKV